MRLLHTPGAVEAVFDDQRLISYAGLEPVMRLAEQCGLRQREVRWVAPADVASLPMDRSMWMRIAHYLAGSETPHLG